MPEQEAKALEVGDNGFSNTVHVKVSHYYYYTREVVTCKKDTELVSGTSNSFPVGVSEREKEKTC